MMILIFRCNIFNGNLSDFFYPLFKTLMINDNGIRCSFSLTGQCEYAKSLLFSFILWTATICKGIKSFSEYFHTIVYST
jgi:hypothetical protein